MSERVAILHIGQPKTGSTSIQHALVGYDDGSTFYATFGIINHILPIYAGFSRDPQNYWYWKHKDFTVDDIQPWKEKGLTALS